MKNIEEQIVSHRVDAKLNMEATASPQLQDTHLRDTEDHTSNHLRDADDPTYRKFINPYFDKHDFEHLRWATRLPHWHQDNKYVFVTFRLADSLPQAKLKILKEEKGIWLKKHPKPWDVEDENEYCDKFVSTIDKWLDSNYGKCLLKHPLNRKLIEDALLFFDGERYNLKAFVIMPNHVHLLMQLKEGFNLESVMRSLKSFTAKEINKVMHRTGRLWQSEYFDRIIRSEDHYKYALKYIVANDRSLAKVKDDSIPYCVEAPLEMEATASSQLQDSHLRDADDSLSNHLRDIDDSLSNHLRPADGSIGNIVETLHAIL
jgi:REP element-mobilizing transposase RayT